MRNVINTFVLIIFCCFLPLSASAADCLPEQGPVTFNENFWNSNPQWICPKGKLIIRLDKSHNLIKEYINLSVQGKNNTEKVKLTLVKYDPSRNQQVHFDGENNSVDRLMMDNLSSGTIFLHPLYTGDLSEGGFTRTLTIINDNTSAICLSGRENTTDDRGKIAYRDVYCK